MQVCLNKCPFNGHYNTSSGLFGRDPFMETAISSEKGTDLSITKDCRAAIRDQS